MHIYVLGAGGECRLFLTIATRCLFGQGYGLAGYEILRQGEFRILEKHVCWSISILKFTLKNINAMDDKGNVTH